MVVVRSLGSELRTREMGILMRVDCLGLQSLLARCLGWSLLYVFVL
jgi:hypothetical protein